MKKRIIELDILKGIAALMMVFDHLCFDLGFVFRNIYKNKLLINICNFCFKYELSINKKIINTIFCVWIFVFVAGITSTLSKSNLKRSLKFLIAALALSLGSHLIEVLSFYFGINIDGIFIFMGYFIHFS